MQSIANPRREIKPFGHSDRPHTLIFHTRFGASYEHPFDDADFPEADPIAFLEDAIEIGSRVYRSTDGRTVHVCNGGAA